MALRGVEFAATAAMVARDSHEGGVEPHCAGLPRSGALSSAVHAAVGAARARHRLALSRAPRPSPEEEQEEDALQPPLLAYACALAAPLLARAGFAGHDMAEAVALVARMDRGNDWPGDATSSRAKQSPLFRAVTERGPLAVGLMAAWTATAAATGGEELRRAWNASWPAPLSPPHRARLALGAAAPLLAHTWEPARRWGVLLLLASLPRSPAAVAFRSPFRIRAKPQREEIDLDGTGCCACHVAPRARHQLTGRGRVRHGDHGARTGHGRGCEPPTPRGREGGAFCHVGTLLSEAAVSRPLPLLHRKPLHSHQPVLTSVAQPRCAMPQYRSVPCAAKRCARGGRATTQRVHSLARLR